MFPTLENTLEARPKPKLDTELETSKDEVVEVVKML
jgi:hypothetical protein